MRYGYKITYAYGSMVTDKSESGYLHWTLEDRGRGLRFEIHTNGAGYGLFSWDNSRGVYKQHSGTCQFSMPGVSREACRRKLKALYEAELDDCADNPLRSPFIERMEEDAIRI